MSKYDPRMLITIYELVKEGATKPEIASVLEISVYTLRTWYKTKPEVRDAVKRGQARKGKSNGADLKEFIYAQLPVELQELWEEIDEMSTNPSMLGRMEAILRNAGKESRQHLFLFSLTTNGFDLSRALKKVNISKRTFDNWCENDLNFMELVQEIEFHKKNFFDSHLVRLVSCGNPAATIFANKTFNKDIYSEKIGIEVSGSVDHKHVVHLDVESLPRELKRELLKALPPETIEGSVNYDPASSSQQVLTNRLIGS